MTFEILKEFEVETPEGISVFERGQRVEFSKSEPVFIGMEQKQLAIERAK